ncbi:GAF domain-containing protein, partial [bacterium]
MTDVDRILEALARSGSTEELYHEVAHGWRDHLGAESVDFLLREPGDGLLLKASTVFPEMTNRMRLGKGIGLSGEAVAASKAVYVSDDAQMDNRYARYPNTEGHIFQALAAFPLLRNDGASLGVLLVRYAEAQPFTPAERQRLEAMAKITSQVVEGFLHAYEAGTRLNRLGALSEVAKTIAASPYLEEILQLLVNLTAQQFDYKVCTVRLLDENRGELVLRATQATVKAYQRKRAIKLGESIAGRAISENRPVIVRDVQVDDDYIGHDLAAEQGLRSMICVPLTLQDKPVGVLSCYTEEVHDFQPDEIKALETLAKQAAVSIEHAKVQVRTTLMQEMHHRVKNNLQQVASLLRLQMRHSSTKTLEEALSECLNRILAISAVHDLLSREDLDHVSIKEISQSLVHHQQSIILPSKKIKFQVRGSDVKLNMTQATQLALVLNELIQNAIEHGFEKADSGEVHINVEENNEELSVWVSNSGDQLPPEFDPTVFSHLGLKLVDNLARDRPAEDVVQAETSPE